MRPYGVDLIWLASDRDGFIAAVISGYAPVPNRVLTELRAVDHAVDQLTKLPQINPLPRLPNALTDDAAQLLSRGVFVFRESGALGSSLHQKEGAPKVRLNATELPSEVRSVIVAINTSFEKHTELDVAGLLLPAELTS